MTNPCRVARRFLLAAFLGALIPAGAAPVTFGFSGTVTSVFDPVGQVPPGVAEGSPFEAILAYDPALLPASFESTPNPARAAYYAWDPAAFAVWARMGGLEMASTPPANKDIQFNLIVRDGDGGVDSLISDMLSEVFWVNHAPTPPNTAGALSFTLSDATQSVFTSDALPLQLPAAAAFNIHRFSMGVFGLDPVTGERSSIYSVTAQIAGIRNGAQPPLTVARQADGSLRLSWPVAAPGFALQSATDFAGAPWNAVGAAAIDTPTEHVVGLPAAAGNLYFRLAKD